MSLGKTSYLDCHYLPPVRMGVSELQGHARMMTSVFTRMSFWSLPKECPSRGADGGYRHIACDGYRLYGGRPCVRVSAGARAASSSHAAGRLACECGIEFSAPHAPARTGG